MMSIGSMSYQLDRFIDVLQSAEQNFSAFDAEYRRQFNYTQAQVNRGKGYYIDAMLDHLAGNAQSQTGGSYDRDSAKTFLRTYLSDGRAGLVVHWYASAQAARALGSGPSGIKGDAILQAVQEAHRTLQHICTTISTFPDLADRPDIRETLQEGVAKFRSLYTRLLQFTYLKGIQKHSQIGSLVESMETDLTQIDAVQEQYSLCGTSEMRAVQQQLQGVSSLENIICLYQGKVTRFIQHLYRLEGAYQSALTHAHDGMPVKRTGDAWLRLENYRAAFSDIERAVDSKAREFGHVYLSPTIALSGLPLAKKTHAIGQSELSAFLFREHFVPVRTYSTPSPPFAGRLYEAVKNLRDCLRPEQPTAPALNLLHAIQQYNQQKTEGAALTVEQTAQTLPPCSRRTEPLYTQAAQRLSQAIGNAQRALFYRTQQASSLQALYTSHQHVHGRAASYQYKQGLWHRAKELLGLNSPPVLRTPQVMTATSPT